ncbi:MAG TPA: hypothetical protein PK102_07580, partial [bacterium]|nr:hypothetical protein [bacterium]
MKVAILILTLFLISCNSKSQNHDSQDEQDLHDLDNIQPDIDTTVSDPDIILDDELIEEIPDEDENVPCLDLKYNENTLKTNFPFKDKDGKPTFCRPGCDT